jgi:hypothetical protein
MHQVILVGNHWYTVIKNDADAILGAILCVVLLAFSAVWLIQKIPPYRKSRKLKKTQDNLVKTLQVLNMGPDPVAAVVEIAERELKESEEQSGDGSVARIEAILTCAAIALGATIGIALGIYSVVH